MRRQTVGPRSPNFRRWPLAGLVVLALLITALVPAVAAAPAAQAGVLRLGYLGAAGSDAANGAQLAIDQINASGGFTAGGQSYQLDLLALAAAPTVESLVSDAQTLAALGIVAYLGPDDSSALSPENVQALVAGGLPILTGATADNLTRDDATDLIFRIRAPERVYSSALAAYLADDRQLTSFLLVQTDVDSTEALLDFQQALQERGITPGDTIQVIGTPDLLGKVQDIVSLNPEVIVMWGPPSDAGLLLKALRANGWGGTLAHRRAEEAARSGAVSLSLVEGLIGVNGWSYGYDGQASTVFLQDYLLAFGQIPGPLAAASYDAIWYLRAALIASGTDPAALRSGLINGAPMSLVTGQLRPAELGGGDMVRTAMVYALGPGGGPTVVAVFDDATRLSQ